MGERIFIQIHRLPDGQIDTSRIPNGVGELYTQEEWEKMVKRIGGYEVIPAILNDDSSLSLIEPKK